MLPSQRLYIRSSSRWICAACRENRRPFSSEATNCIAEGDRVILRRVKDTGARPIFTKPLRHGRKTLSNLGSIQDEDLIGKRPRDVIKSSSGTAVRVSIPSLAEYVRLTPRLVTPVYPADANLIVSLLDIHVSPPSVPTNTGPTLEILEAGTGHGALTLHLARAIHGANPSPIMLNDLRPSPGVIHRKSTSSSAAITSLGDMKSSDGEPKADVICNKQDVAVESALQAHRSQRMAVIHTVDASQGYSDYACKIVNGFQHGRYRGDVDFYVDDVSQWVDHQIEIRGLHRQKPSDNAFLSHIILDLPDSHLHIEKAASALRVDGVLLVFNPSISQIMKCVHMIKQLKLPLELDRVLELGANMTGGREWDVRAIRPRSKDRPKVTETKITSSKDEPLVSIETKANAMGSSEPPHMETLPMQTEDEEQVHMPRKEETDWEMVCRPMYGSLVTAGGFVGMWRKMLR